MSIYPDSVTHRYTPPTCTLEIFAPFKRNSLLAQGEFRLKFDDPRLSQEEQIIVEGDRHLLETLYQTVSEYLTKWLSPPTIYLPIKPELEAGDSQCHLQAQDLLHHQLQVHDVNLDQTIRLSATQLFDLANALDQYYLDTATVLAQNHHQTRSAIQAVAAIAITIGIGSVIGIATQPAQLANQSTAVDDLPFSLLDESSSKILISPPVIPESDFTPTPQPEIPDTLTSTQKLPAPPPVDAPKPPPNIPDPAKILLNPPPVKPIVIAPQPPTNQTQTPAPQTETKIQPQPTKPPASDSSPAQTPNLPPPTVIETESNPDLAATTNSQLNTSAQIKPNSSDDETGDFIAAISEPELTQLPQIMEVKRYFRRRWQAPNTLNQAIQYRLQLDSDGSIARVIPIGQTAAIYLDRSSIPLMGETFVSPLKTQDTATVRLVLNPDGSVEVFAE